MMCSKAERKIDGTDRVVKNIRRQTRRSYSAEDTIRIVVAGLRSDYSIAELCHQTQGQYYA